MSEPVVLDEEKQSTLLNLESVTIDPYWVDPNQALEVPINPLHYAAHKYQVILARLDRQAQKNPAQFNSGNYIAIVEKLEKLWEAINAQRNALGLGKNGESATTSPVGNGTSPAMAAGVSANNPLAG